jgi:hypothetical protein
MTKKYISRAIRPLAYVFIYYNWTFNINGLYIVIDNYTSMRVIREGHSIADERLKHTPMSDIIREPDIHNISYIELLHKIISIIVDKTNS